MLMRRLEREVSMKINMMLFVCSVATMAGNAFASSQLFAATFSVPTMPEAEWDDTLPLFAGVGHGARRLSGRGLAESRDSGLHRELSAVDKNTIMS